MRWFDSHAHLQDEKFADDLPNVIERAKAAGVKRVLLPGADYQSVVRAEKLAAEESDYFCYSSGIHPHDADTVDDNMLNYIKTLAEGTGFHKPVAIGEVGLDYHYDFSPRNIQRAVFEQFIEIAWYYKLPLIIHCREATEDCLSILRSKAAQGRLLTVPGVFHCFSGSAQTADTLIDMGFYLGFDGPITFKNSRKAAEVIKIAPLERLLIETDSPYLAPEPLRGKRNEPSYLPYIGRKLAELKGISTEEAADITWQNTCRLFQIPV
jgi:TatD DNase family protein